MSTITPILRIFDYAKAIEFYINWLGFKVDWEHEFEPGTTPKYMQVSLRDLVLHLSEHHGDASPGTHIRINNFEGLIAYNKELNDKKYKYGRPGLQVPEWNQKAIYMTVYDPFGNRITFNEEVG